MDLYCSRCGEPCEHYTVYNDMDTEEREAFLSGKYCVYCKGTEIKSRPVQAEAMSMLTSILGDDTDGIAAELEDMEYMGMFNAE